MIYLHVEIEFTITAQLLDTLFILPDAIVNVFSVFCSRHSHVQSWHVCETPFWHDRIGIVFQLFDCFRFRNMWYLVWLALRGNRVQYHSTEKIWNGKNEKSKRSSGRITVMRQSLCCNWLPYLDWIWTILSHFQVRGDDHAENRSSFTTRYGTIQRLFFDVLAGNRSINIRSTTGIL